MGRLTLVGMGHRLAGHLTAEAQAELGHAQHLFHLVDDPLAVAWLEGQVSSVESLIECLHEGESSYGSLEAMTERVLARLSQGERVCVVFPGHPTILVPPCQALLTAAQTGGHTVAVLPGVSAVDCLFADLGLDPAVSGWQVFDATAFLLHGKRPDPTAALILLQAGLLGMQRYARENEQLAQRLDVLVQRLREFYPGPHEVVLYGASACAPLPPRLERVPLARLGSAKITFATTLYVPPLEELPVDAKVARRLGMES